MSTLLFAEALNRSGRDILLFLQEAYLWKFDKFYDCKTDAINYRHKGDVPPYALEYAKFLLRGEHDL